MLSVQSYEYSYKHTCKILVPYDTVRKRVGELGPGEVPGTTWYELVRSVVYMYSFVDPSEYCVVVPVPTKCSHPGCSHGIYR